MGPGLKTLVSVLKVRLLEHDSEVMDGSGVIRPELGVALRSGTQPQTGTYQIEDYGFAPDGSLGARADW